MGTQDNRFRLMNDSDKMAVVQLVDEQGTKTEVYIQPMSSAYVDDKWSVSPQAFKRNPRLKKV